MTITLLDDSTVDGDFVRFDPQFYQFYLGSGSDAQNLTNLIRRADKLTLIPEFSIEKDNERLYVEKYIREHGTLPPDLGPTSTWDIFWEQISSDPLRAPVEGLGKLFRTAAEKVATTTTGHVLLIGLAIWAYLKLRR